MLGGKFNVSKDGGSVSFGSQRGPAVFSKSSGGEETEGGEDPDDGGGAETPPVPGEPGGIHVDGAGASSDLSPGVRVL